MKIREVVEVPDIDKIVRLTDNMSDKADAEKLKGLLKGYVITESVEKNLSNFFYKITNFKDKGHGFLISGLPGCGKSHFMSVLGLLTKNSEAFDIMNGKSESIDKSKKFFQDKKVFVVPLMAEEGGPEISLEEMFFDAAENITGFPFSDASFYIKQFEEAIVANSNYEQKVNNFVQEDSKGRFLTWSDFRAKIKSEEGITRLIKSFVDKYEITFFKPNRGRKERLDNLYKWLSEENYDAVLVLVDELSEYLNDRGGRARTDALFLKTFLENAQQERNGKIIPAWIVGAFLSSLNDIKVPDVYDLMKDRFPSENQFTLKVDDVEDIIDQRLVVKKQPDKIEEAYITLKKKYNAFDKVEKDTFMKIYPLHPESLDILSKSVRFLSRQRSIVDFVLSEVKGNIDEGGHTKGILDEDFLKLVTPDRILSHFQERIRELSDKREYFESIYAYYMGPEGLGNGKIKELFKDNESDKDTACKLIDVMTLLKILDLEKEYTVRDLTYMIQYPKMEGDFAEEKVNKILFKMYDKGRFIEFEEDENSAGGNIYFINKDVSLATKITQDMKKKLALVEGESIVSIVDEIVTTLSQEPLSLNGYYNEPSSIRVNWNNINREGVVLFNNLTKTGIKEGLSKSLTNLKESENDFYMYIGTFLNTEKQKEYIEKALKEVSIADSNQTFSLWGNHEDDSSKDIEKRLIKSIIYWLPSNELEREEGKEKLYRLKEYFAYTELYKEYEKNYQETNSNENRELLGKVEEKILNLQDEIFEILKGLYLNGGFYNIDGDIDIDISAYGKDSFTKIMNTVVDAVLSKVYKDNKFISPDENIGLTDKVTNKFINNYITGTQTDLLGIDLSIIKNIVKKFGEAQIRIDSFKFNIDAKNNNLVKLIIDEVNGKGEVIYKNLYNKTRKSTFGPDKNIVDILLAMMIKKGFLLPIKNDMPVSIANVKAPLNSSVTKFKMGEFVEEKYHEGLIRITKLFFNKKFEKQDLSFQEELWEELIQFKKTKLNEISDINNKLNEFKEPLKLDDNKLFKTYEAINFMKTLVEDIAEDNGSKDGLEYFIEKNNTEISEGLLEKYYENLNKIYTWAESTLPIDIRKVNVTINGYREFIPDKEDYKELLSQYNSMKELLNNGDEFIFSNYASELNKKFTIFKNDYISLYVEEHNRENGKPEFDELRTVLEEDNFKFLNLLNEIERINMDYDYMNIKNDIDSQLRHQCNLSSIKFLKDNESACKCSFKLGQKKVIEDKEEYLEAITTAVLGYIDQLNLEVNKEKVFKYIGDLKEIGERKDIIQLVEKMYEIPLDENRLDSYRKYLTVNSEIVPFIDKALKVNINIIQRDINKLLEVFNDKTYSKEEMIDKFTALIEGNDTLNRNNYIKFTNLRNDN